VKLRDYSPCFLKPVSAISDTPRKHNLLSNGPKEQS
jgi:hypothetical protein